MSLTFEADPVDAPVTAADYSGDPRIQRIARAMCRAARIDPDQPAGGVAIFKVMHCQVGRSENDPAWTLFQRQAELFVAMNPDVVGPL
ncbi:hypothetical protein [Bosea sp. 2RAB26]|uniref:hypothetical protein n=1 Tax=Bosea sp. 2RAB26 TaxID=3237476 RepID=UPI003F90BD7D